MNELPHTDQLSYTKEIWIHFVIPSKGITDIRLERLKIALKVLVLYTKIIFRSRKKIFVKCLFFFYFQALLQHRQCHCQSLRQSAMSGSMITILKWRWQAWGRAGTTRGNAISARCDVNLGSNWNKGSSLLPRLYCMNIFTTYSGCLLNMSVNCTYTTWILYRKSN